MCRSVLMSVLLTVLVGCSSEPYKYAPVSGHITQDGKAVANVAVIFSPVAPKGSIDAGPGSTGKTDAEGRYTLTVVGKDIRGALIGKHVVLISQAGQEEVDTSDDSPRKFKRISKKDKRDQPRTFDVPPGGTEEANFDLKSNK
jgi:hypothetical protein